MIYDFISHHFEKVRTQGIKSMKGIVFCPHPFKYLLNDSFTIFFNGNTSPRIVDQTGGIRIVNHFKRMPVPVGEWKSRKARDLVIVLVSLTINQALAKRSWFLVMAGSAFLIGAGFGLYALTATKLAYAAGVVIWTLGELIGSPIAPTILADLSPLHHRGFYQSLNGASFGLAAFIGPVVGGAIYSHFGATALWTTCLAAGTLAALGHAFIMSPMYRRIKHTEPEQPVPDLACEPVSAP